MKETHDHFHDLLEHGDKVPAYSNNRTTIMLRAGLMGLFTKTILISVHCLFKIAHSRYPSSALSEKFWWVP